MIPEAMKANIAILFVILIGVGVFVALTIHDKRMENLRERPQTNGRCNCIVKDTVFINDSVFITPNTGFQHPLKSLKYNNHDCKEFISDTVLVFVVDSSLKIPTPSTP